MVLRIALLTVLVTSIVICAEGVQQQDKDYTVSVDVQLVQLPVWVLDRDGHPVSGLQKDHFQVFEDGVLQDISLFKHEDVPMSVGLVIDNSGSMHNKRERVNRAALTFARESNPDDETFIVDFDDAVYLEHDFTGNIADLVLLTSNPLENIRNTQKINAVIVNGRFLDRAALDQLLTHVEAAAKQQK